MDDIKNILIGAIVTLIIGLVGATIRYFAKRKTEQTLDRVELEADLNATADSGLLDRIGCPCLSVTVKCKGQRTAKVNQLVISAPLADDDLAAIESGFKFPLGQSGNPSLPAAQIHIPLIPDSERTNEHGFILERDDIAKFHFPLAVPAIPIFLKAPSEEVRITAELFDGTALVLRKGLGLQEYLRDMLKAYGNLPMSIKPDLRISVTVSAESFLDVSGMLGRVNEAAIDFDRSETREEPIIGENFTEERIHKCVQLHESIWENWEKTKSLQYKVIPDSPVDLQNPENSSEVSFAFGINEPDHTIKLVDLLVIFALFARRVELLRSAQARGATQFQDNCIISTRFTSSQAAALLNLVQFSD